MGVVVVQQTGGPYSEEYNAARVHLDSDGSTSFSQFPNRAPSSRSAPLLHRMKTALATAFLPAGYPFSVTPDYLSFQIWDTVQAICSYVRGMLSTQAMLAGIGVGSATATPAAAIVQFFFRDAVGLLASVLFAAFQGSSFDAYAKQWRLTADVANDIGLTIELAAPAFPSFFLGLACAASICRAITGMAGGATRMALTQHFALQGNAADIAAKEGSQETAVTLIGMIMGLGLTRLGSTSPRAAWVAFAALTVLHVYANLRAMRCLHICRLNPERLTIILPRILQGARIPTPEEVGEIERLLPPVILRWMPLVLGYNQGRKWTVVMTPQLSQFNRKTRQLVADHFSKLKKEESEITLSEQEGRFTLVMDRPCRKVYVFLGVNASEPNDVIESFCAATMRVWLEDPHNIINKDNIERILGIRLGDAEDDKQFTVPWLVLKKVLDEAGWTCERPALLQNDERFNWGNYLIEKKSN